MLGRWLRRHRWLRAANFRVQVDIAHREIVDLRGEAALEAARRKVQRTEQPIRRKRVGKAVVAQLVVERRAHQADPVALGV